MTRRMSGEENFSTALGYRKLFHSDGSPLGEMTNYSKEARLTLHTVTPHLHVEAVFLWKVL